MSSDTSRDDNIFSRLGVTRVINASGVYTDLGGSIISPTVWAAMQDINGWYVSMPELLDRTGAILAGIVGAEAARVVPGASAAIALGAAACAAGNDPAKWQRLPDTTGMRNEVIVQRRQRYKYDRCATLAGVRLVEAGTADDTQPAHIERAISAQTAAILFPAHLDGRPGTVPLRTVVSLARTHGVPVLVDAAYMNDPPAIMRSYTAAGADLVCFSAKYYGGPNAGGFICGRRDLMTIVAGLDFTGYEAGEYRQFGRAFKLDRQLVVGVVLALQEWMAIDPAVRWESYRRRVDAIARHMAGVKGVECAPMWFTMDERLTPERVNCLAVKFATHPVRTAAKVSELLAQGDPSIRTPVVDGTLVVAVDTVLDGQEEVVGERLRAVCLQLEATIPGHGSLELV